MYCIEMWEESGHWNIKRWGNKKHCRGCDPNDKFDLHFHWTDYEWVPGAGRWVQLGGRFATVEEAEAKIAEYRKCGSWKKPREFRVV
jgi:hypothetical protein